MKKVKRLLKRNMFNIPFAVLTIALLCFASRVEYDTELQEGQGHPKEPSQAVYAMEMKEVTVEYVPSVQEQIISACKDRGIPSDIAMAIAKLETGHFTSAAFVYGNNVGGLSVEEEPVTYSNLEDGIDAFVNNLSINYFGKGLDTPEAIGRKYCPANAREWADAVRGLM